MNQAASNDQTTAPENAPLHFDVVIAGGGFAGIYAARAIGRALGDSARDRVALIAEGNFMVFQPMLAEVVGSAVSPRHIVNPIRLLCRQVTTLRGRITGIDLPARRLTLHAGHFTHDVNVKFHHLALSLGSVVDLSRVPGMPEHAFLLKNVGDALELRSAIIDRFEEANFQRDRDSGRRLLTFVVVGGGYSGVETAGQIVDLIEEINRLYPRIAQDEYRVVLVHSRDHLMPEVNSSLARYCEGAMRARGVELLLGRRVRAMTAGRVFLDDGSTIETHTVVSTVGNAAHPLIVQLCRDHNIESQAGRIVTDETLRVKGHDGLWAAGDCAAIPLQNPRRKDQRAENTCPPTAQFALREGLLLGQNIARALRHQAPKPFAFGGLGELAAIGHHSAVAEIPGMKFSGFTAWFLWRTIYLSKLPGLERKLRVVIDWTLDLFFTRDINLLRSQPTDVLQRMHLEKGDKVFQVGEPVLSLYILKSGRIDLLDGKGLVRSLGPGEYFGERALLHDKVWKFSAVAQEPTELVALSGDVFGIISGASPSIHKFFERSAMRFTGRAGIESLLSALPPEVRAMKVGELMNPDVVTMGPTMKLVEALQMMVKYPYNSFPIADDEGKPQGLVSQSDLYVGLRSEKITLGSTLNALSVSSAPSIVRDASVPEAVERFYRSGSNKLLVVDADGRLTGILTPIDLLAKSRGPLPETAAQES